jgi:hypothetical protein
MFFHAHQLAIKYINDQKEYYRCVLKEQPLIHLVKDWKGMTI